MVGTYNIVHALILQQHQSKKEVVRRYVIIIVKMSVNVMSVPYIRVSLTKTLRMDLKPNLLESPEDHQENGSNTYEYCF